MAADGPKGRGDARRDRAYWEDIVHSAKRIAVYAAGLTFKKFAASDLLQDAVLRRLTVIGEAAACLSAAFKKRTPEIPWKKVVGFRNLVVHRYWSVDLQIVWRIVDEEIPGLLRSIRSVSPE